MVAFTINDVAHRVAQFHFTRTMTTASREQHETPASAAPAPLPLPANLTTALIGGGKISEQHLLALRDIDGVAVRGICDLSPALARFTAERFDVDAWYTDHRVLLDECDANVVHVLTPPATHDQIVRDCLAAGRHVIVEKPIALSHAAFRTLWDDAASRGLHLVENHNYRFNRPIRRIAKIIADGQIGTVEEVDVRMVLNIRSGGRYADVNLPHSSHALPAGIIHEFITHMSYLLLHFLPNDAMDTIEVIRAAWHNHGADDLFRYDDLDAMLISGTTHGRLRFSCRQWPDCLAIEVRGSDGIVAAELFYPTIRVMTRRSVGQHLTPLLNSIGEARARAASGFGSVWQKIRNRTAYEGLASFLAATYHAMREGSALPVDYHHMDRASRLIDCLLDSEHRA